MYEDLKIAPKPILGVKLPVLIWFPQVCLELAIEEHGATECGNRACRWFGSPRGEVCSVQKETRRTEK